MFWQSWPLNDSITGTLKNTSSKLLCPLLIYQRDGTECNVVQFVDV